MANPTLTDTIDDLLPQTQCGLCGYGGCRPYAEAMTMQQEKINLCPPGGIPTLLALANALEQNAAPFIEDMAKKIKPPSKAFIREDECIGCTKCIQACPVDAIIGSAKLMHSVITSECTGCELCVEPCPVDCIELIPIDPLPLVSQREKSKRARQRFQARNNRLQSAISKEIEITKSQKSREEKIKNRKILIDEAIARAKLKKGK